MGFVGLFLLTAVAVAADLDECVAGGSACPAAQRGASLLQHGVHKVKSDSLAAQQLEREVVRRETIVRTIIDRRLLILASMVREGMSEPDAVAVMRTVATEFTEGDDLGDLTSNSELRDLVEEGLVPLHEMICKVRGLEAGCGSEWQEYIDDALSLLSNLKSSMIQLVVGGTHSSAKKEKEARQLASLADVEDHREVVNLLKEQLRLFLKVIVKSGEDPASAVDLGMEAMTQLAGMPDSELLKYSKDSKAELAKTYFLSVLHSACLPTTESCSDLLSTMVWAADQEAHGEPTLLQVVVRPAVSLVMRFYGLPEFPEETAAERAMATKAYLEKKGSRIS